MAAAAVGGSACTCSATPQRCTAGPDWARLRSPARAGLVQGSASLAGREVNRAASRARRRGVKGARGGLLLVAPAAQQGRTRLSDVFKSVPSRLDKYFADPFRRALFGGISLLGGFYVAQTISLSFGALGVNDVVASALCVLFTEYVTRFYQTRVKPGFYAALLNVFKMGFTYGLFIDAFKLAS